MSSNKKIVFLGDSFTWGEGLELYSNDPKWIAERELDNNSWPLLEPKQDDISTSFRESNRFSALVGKNLNCEYFTEPMNGGNLARNFDNLNRILIKNKGITDVIVQFSHFRRDPLHLSYNCSCDFCIETGWVSPLSTIYNYLHSIIDASQPPIPNSDKLVIDYISSKISSNLKIDNNVLAVEDISFLEDATKYLKDNYKKQLNILIHMFIIPYEFEYNIKFHFIDSWDIETSELIFSNNKISSNLIPLIGKDRKKYLKWNDWLSTFSSKSIMDDFPKTKNTHPTLEMNEYIAKSIIYKLKKEIM